jgi:hypothetical protein
MLPPRACKLSAFQVLSTRFHTYCPDAFIGLNGVRILSIIALLLVFSSNIVTLADDIKAVNRFVAAGNEIGANGSSNSTVSGGSNSTSFTDFDYIA